jgi:hypothetical protein
MQDVITDILPMHNLAAERLGYPTQKPMALLERRRRSGTRIARSGRVARWWA